MFTLTPPKVKQLLEMIGNARNGFFSILRDQFDLTGSRPHVARPSIANGVKSRASPGHAALKAATVSSVAAGSSSLAMSASSASA